MQTSASVNFNHSGSTVPQRKKRRTKRDIYNTDNSTSVEWQKYFDIADQLNQTNSSVIISLDLSTLMGTNLNNYYRYAGSLTTPPCTENVIWTVFQSPIVFTAMQLASFRSNIFFENYRGPQPINGRTVYRNFPNATTSSIPDYACCVQNTGSNETSDGSSNGNSLLFMNKQLLAHSFLFLLIYFLI